MGLLARVDWRTSMSRALARRASGFLLTLLSKPPRTEFTCFRQAYTRSASDKNLALYGQVNCFARPCSPERGTSQTMDDSVS
jgi:hypothetical protein